MTVQTCARMREAWTGSGTITGGNRYMLSYLVETDDKGDGPLTIVQQAQNVGPHTIPSLFDTYSIGNDLDSTVVHTQRSSRKIKDIATGALWQIDCQFERPGTKEQNDLHPPLQRPTKYRLEWAQFSWKPAYDVFGNPIKNLANQDYPEPIVIDDARPVFVAEKAMPSLSAVLSLAAVYRNAVNTDAFYGTLPRHAKVESITCGEMETEEGQSFYPTVFRIQIADRPWDFVKREIGYAKINLADGIPDTLQVASDFTGMGHAEPIDLNADGEEKAITDDPIYTSWRVYPERNFSGLGI